MLLQGQAGTAPKGVGAAAAKLEPVLLLRFLQGEAGAATKGVGAAAADCA